MMNPKRYLENHFRGWLPKEPSRPIQDINITPHKVEPEKQGDKKLRQVIFATFFVGSILLGVFLAMGFGLYAAVVIGAAMPLVIAVATRRLNPRQRGSKEVMTPSQRKGVNLVLMFNVAILGLYLTLYYMIIPILSNAEIALAIVVGILAVWLLVNRLLLRNMRKQAVTPMDKKV